MPRITGNKGEWSELYVLLELLATGKLYAADENIRRIDTIYFPLLKILRDEGDNRNIVYEFGHESSIELYINGVQIKRLSMAELKQHAETLFNEIKRGTDRAFSIEAADGIMEQIECKKIKAPSSDKTDIKMQVLDINTGYSPVCGFSIKSELGSAPTLLNAGRTTNFQYEISGITDADMLRINAIDDPRSKIMDRMNAICEIGTLRFTKAQNTTFSSNLMLIDSLMDDIVSKALEIYYKHNISSCKAVIEKLEEDNPLGFPGTGFYEYKFKKFLCSVALGMTPSRVWDGRDEANGGYIIVTTDGDVLAYHIYNRDYFEQYLLNNTKFERASTTRHDFASIYKEGDRFFINLNLQIRFTR